MRKVTFTLLALCLFGLPIHSQTKAETEVRTLIKAKDFLMLQHRYADVKDSLPPLLNTITEAYLDYAFNRPAQSIEKINSLMEHHQQDLDWWEELLPLVMLWSEQLSIVGRYAESADILQAMLSQLRTVDFPVEGLNKAIEVIASFHRQSEALRHTPPMTIRRLLTGSKKVRMTMDVPQTKIGWMVPVTIGNIKMDFLLDTGAAVNLMSNKDAKRLGVRIMADSILVGGMGGLELMQLGIIDTLRIGNVECLNSLVWITYNEGILPKIIRDSLGFDTGPILGIEILRSLGNVEISPRKHTVCFPKPVAASTMGTTSNMMLVERSPRIEAHHNQTRLLLALDSGLSMSACMKADSVNRYMNFVNTPQTEERLRLGGIGGIKGANLEKLADFPLKVSNKEVKIENAYAEAGKYDYDGLLGLHYFNRMDKIIFDFKKMTFTVK
ncbi:MAG: retroviral-like aspartic protease family protein [Mediterranea sp.]|jgi:predicted aspartyl protease|nr:retroviral-like aspartic protease family protein [Mediterranea sp.]